MMGHRGTAAAGACFSPGEADTVSVNYGTEYRAAKAPKASPDFKLFSVSPITLVSETFDY